MPKPPQLPVELFDAARSFIRRAPLMYQDMASGMPRQVRCERCGLVQAVDPAYCLQHGWPKHCQQTMRLYEGE
jgi:hypothetical protein